VSNAINAGNHVMFILIVLKAVIYFLSNVSNVLSRWKVAVQKTVLM
jgi:hypothetical protein